VSEAAAAHYVCAGCGCRYCGAACQAAGWRSRKKACIIIIIIIIIIKLPEELPEEEGLQTHGSMRDEGG
jgi:hypothetical protein